MASEEDTKKTAGEFQDLEPCDKPHTAEAMRNDREDEACDDGVR